MTEYFDKHMILEIIQEGESENGARLVDKEIEELTRWDVHYKVVFEFDAKLYMFSYSEGLTEMQDHRPFEYEDEVECIEVEPKEQTVIVYVEKE